MNVFNAAPFTDRITTIHRRNNTAEEAPVLVVVSEPGLALDVCRELEISGHAVVLSRSAASALEALRSGRRSAVVIDRNLNAEDGLSIIASLRDEGDTTPVLVVGEPAVVDERIAILKAGADDYMAKPLEVRELVVRLEAILRRAGRGGVVTQLRVGEIEMDLVGREVRCMGRLIDLLPREFTLLEYFMRHPGEVVSRTKLLEDVWGSKRLRRMNVVDVQIGNLRRKLDPTGDRRSIINVRGAGFKLAADARTRGAGVCR
jgi:two-component system, OmpR family, response regulator